MPVAEFAQIFLLDCENKWKPSTFKTNSRAVKTHIIPAFGERVVSDIEHHEVVRWYSNMSGKEGYRNRILAVFSDMMKHAEVFGLREAGSNPCRGLRKHKCKFEAQYLDAKDYAKLGQALRQHEDQFPLQVSFIWFLALTGCRKGEAEAAQWGQLARNYIALPDSKTGPKAIWLGSPVRKLLRELPKTQSHIFAPCDDKDFQKHLVKVWDDVRTHLKRPKFRLHDLRHSFASTAINAGYDLRVIGGLLGHSDPDTTAGYAHLNKKKIEEASDRVGKHFEKTLGKKEKRLEPTTGLKATRKQSRFVRFVQSNLNVPDFCKSEGLDQKTFRRELLKWRELNQKGMGK
jgi:integrase